MKNIQNSEKTSCRHKLFAASIAAFCTSMIATSVTQASDIDIYQEAKSGTITLMFMLDISGSMGGNSYDGTSQNRIARLKTAMKDLLGGNSDKGITRISDDKVLGLSTLGARYSSNNYNTGAVLVPARRLDVLVGTKTQRQILLDAVDNLGANTNTPTARSFAETVAYLMGTTTAAYQRNVVSMPYYFERNNNKKYSCSSWNNTYTSCSTWSETNDLLPSGSHISTRDCSVKINDTNRSGTCYDYTGVVEVSNNNSGFNYSHSTTKNGSVYQSPNSLTQEEEIKKCSGQGIYVLTDGDPTQDSDSLPLMQGALGSQGQNFTCDNSSYDCLNKLALNLLDPTKNPASLKFKTAVVGFGSSFNDVSSYDKTKTQAENIAALGRIDSNVKKAAYWGIIGEGGWYSGNSSQDVVDSVNAFLGELGTDIPSVTTGSPTIPKDALNPAVLQDDAYYQQFQPTPDKSYRLWVGNLKKYLVGSSGKLQGRSNKDVNDSRGRLITPTYDANGKLTSAVYDFWSYGVDSNTAIADADENTIGSRKFAAKGGAWSQLKLRAANGTVQRKLLTNRVGTGTGTAATFTSSNTALRTVNLNYLTDTTYKDDPSRGYLMSLLGYNVDAANPGSITTTSLAASAELRQMGAVMHSLPVLVTNKGKVTYDATTKKIGSTGREDYVLFGTTQGLLHVVDALTGQEKFAFVPNEMVDKQKEGFSNYTSTSGGISNLYYGVDGPWTVHTEYVIDGSGNLTVGTGKGINQKGKQLAFGGLRMGGRSYYSLDLRNIDSPKLNFHINPDAASANTPLSYMGESWSKPTVAYVNWGGVRKLVMFVGGGYDRTGGTDGKGYENDSYDQINKKGAGVYMFSAEGSDAGSLLWWASANATTSAATATSAPVGRNDANLKYSVVSEIRAVDRDSDDLVDHLYFGDLSGQLFRIDLDNKASALGAFAKAPVRLFNLHKNDGKSARFYDMPSFSIYNEKGSIFAVLSVGSGNRSQPLQNYTVGTAGVEYDAIYNIYDKDVARKDLLSATSWNTKDITALGLITEENRYSNSTIIAPYSTNGWYYKFDNCVAGSDGTKTDCDKYKLQSEKVFGTPLAMNYRLYVSTFDSSKPGISGDCGAGVKGESFLTTFCLPFGQCKSKDPVSGGGRGTPIGIGIQNITTGNDKPAECTGSNCGGGTGGGGGQDDNKKVTSSSNYCANTGGRIIVTTTSSGGTGEATQMCLIPQRWYEKNILIK
ncbi:pilus assembly protein PilY [Acinetobacter sp.]|uniref:pilus assembly protein PilY n=1 Tax=Acinetobacter sp. TaxID=472 RepID=UPI003BB037DF